MKHTPGLKPGTNIETSARTRDCLLANETNDASDSLRGKRTREREKGKTSARGAGGSDAGGSRLFSLPRSFDFPPPPHSTACHASYSNDKRCHQEISQINDLNSFAVSFLCVCIAWRESITFLVFDLIMSCLADVVKILSPCSRKRMHKANYKLSPLHQLIHYFHLCFLRTFGAFGTVTKM